ncbi:MAG: (deoxy)nucleoside triphosphate pyrophosphohydrolase [Actinomycetes bacterium]
MTAPSLVVVAAALLDPRGRLLAARRSAPAAVAGGWELPGGKVEPGESEPDALHRELREELGVEVELGDRVGGSWQLDPQHRPGAVLHVWTALVRRGTPAALEDHDELRWLPPGQWFDVEWLPADLPVVRHLAALPALPALPARWNTRPPSGPGAAAG